MATTPPTQNLPPVKRPAPLFGKPTPPPPPGSLQPDKVDTYKNALLSYFGAKTDVSAISGAADQLKAIKTIYAAVYRLGDRAASLSGGRLTGGQAFQKLFGAHTNYVAEKGPLYFDMDKDKILEKNERVSGYNDGKTVHLEVGPLLNGGKVDGTPYSFQPHELVLHETAHYLTERDLYLKEADGKNMTGWAALDYLQKHYAKEDGKDYVKAGSYSYYDHRFVVPYSAELSADAVASWALYGDPGDGKTGDPAHPDGRITAFVKDCLKNHSQS